MQMRLYEFREAPNIKETDRYMRIAESYLQECDGYFGSELFLMI